MNVALASTLLLLAMSLKYCMADASTFTGRMNCFVLRRDLEAFIKVGESIEVRIQSA